MAKRRVVITGKGVLAPKAIGAEAFWEQVSQGQSGIGPITTYPMNSFRLTYGGEITDFEPRKMVPNRKALKVMARDIQLAIAATKMCMDDSQIKESGVDPTRLGVSMGAGLINTSVEEMRVAVKESLDKNNQFDIQKYAAEGMKGLTPLWLLKYLPNMLSCHTSIEYDAQGPSNSLTTGCAASSQAIGEAFRIIERGDADAMIAGGAESKLDPLSWSRLDMLGLLTKNGQPAEKCIRPFDGKRDGFLPGEAAAVLILEELEHAQKRGAHIYGELIGFSSSANPSPMIKEIDSKAQRSVMEQALKDAGITPEDVDVIFAHGLGLVATDRIEAQAIKDVFKEEAKTKPVTSFKASTGYIGATAGGLGVNLALAAMKEGLIPPTLNYENRDDECDLNVVSGQSQKANIQIALINAFGLTGQNASLVVKKFEL